MKKYLESEAVYRFAKEQLEPETGMYSKGRNNGLKVMMSAARSEAIPAADVVAKDCFNQVLWENDVMRGQLASIGKGLGDTMDDVRHVVFCTDCVSEHICGTSYPNWFCAAGRKKNDND